MSTFLPPSASSYLEPDSSCDEGQSVVAKVPVVMAHAHRKKPKQKTPQEAIDEFWSKFTTKAPGKATTVIPHNQYIQKAAKKSKRAVGKSTQASYDEAAQVCRDKVAKIVKECRRVNQKYRDPHFDLEIDLKWGNRDTLESLSNDKDKSASEFKPKSVKRVTDIFENPKFYIDGPTANDVRQGRDGDCWFLAALCTLSNKPSLIERCCVAQDPQVGVYGFVFHRDGEWISEIIDDKLFLIKPDFDESFIERMLWEDRERINSEEQYRKAYQSGSGALYFAQCEHADETWLPLLEKAYAKAHGDYAAIEGGFTGEGIEDLTGGVTSELYTTDILDKEYFWKEELMKVNTEFLFGCSTGMWGLGWGERKGIQELHAYSVMRAVDIDGQRLVLLKNPWGKGEWKGAWSDGSKEWTAEWLVKLDHRFGDDGAFWISYDDLLRKYQVFDRTRLFGPEWKVTSLWTTLSVPWTLDYHDTQFAFSLSKPGPVVLVLSQLDDRYYRGLEGQYRFELNFRLHKAGQEGYLVRSNSPYCQKRSVNVELELKAGDYLVLLKINAVRDMDILPIEEVIRNNARDRRDKLVAVGMSYDLAHSKGKVIETEEEKKAKKEAEKRKKEKEKKELRKTMMEEKRQKYYLDVKDLNKRREKRAKLRAKAKVKKAREAEKAKQKAGKKGQVKEGEESKKTGTVAIEKQEKHVQIQSPHPTPSPDETKQDLTAKDTDSTPESGTIQTPSTESEKSPPREQPAAEVKLDPETTSDKPAQDEPVASIEQAEVTGPKLADQPVKGLDDAPSDPKPEPKAESVDAGDTQADAKREAGETEEEEEEEEEEDTSDASTESDVSSVSEISDRELDIVYEQRSKSPNDAPPPPPLPGPPEEEDEFESNPWNAVVTVGFRVYYKVSEDDKDQEMVKLWVKRPSPSKKGRDKDGSKDEEGDEDDDDETEEDKTDDEGDNNEQGLDVDDSSKDATLFGDQERRKKSIIPNEKAAPVEKVEQGKE